MIGRDCTVFCLPILDERGKHPRYFARRSARVRFGVPLAPVLLPLMVTAFPAEV